MGSVQAAGQLPAGSLSSPAFQEQSTRRGALATLGCSPAHLWEPPLPPCACLQTLPGQARSAHGPAAAQPRRHHDLSQAVARRRPGKMKGTGVLRPGVALTMKVKWDLLSSVS